MSSQSSGNEFNIIEKYFRPLAAGADGALGLLDDAAILGCPDGCELVVTTDAVVSGVHFLESLSPQDIAHKVIGVNLSDLAAMGAKPRAVFLAAQFTQDIDENWIQNFADGLGEVLERSGAKLMGGDTVSTPGPMAFTLTAIGHVPTGKALKRAGAKPGDLIFATGTIGDGALGLLVAQNQLNALSDEHQKYLRLRYARPKARCAVGADLSNATLITAAADISDGLIADLGHICKASGVGAIVEAEQVPVSDAVRTALNDNSDLLQLVLTGGDDYELVFTAPEDALAQLEALSETHNVPITAIGRIEHPETTEKLCESAVCVVDTNGNPLDTGTGGYRHL